MEEAEQIIVKEASATMDLAHKTMLYEVMKKNVGLTTLISVFIPGGGQIYLTQYLKGVLILVFSWLIIPWLYGIYDAHASSNKYNDELHMLIFPPSLAITSAPAQIQEQK